MSGRPVTAVRSGTTEAGLLEVLRPLVAQLVADELERRLDALAAPEWLTLGEAAARYRTSADALRKRAQRGQLAGAVRDGARWLVDRRALDAALVEATIRRNVNMGRAPVRRPRPGTRRY